MTTTVLIHGLGSSSRIWAPVLAHLDGRAALAVNLLGGVSIAQEATRLDEQLPAGDQLVNVGHSMGGLVATALAERAPDRVRRLVLVSSPPTLESRVSARTGPETLLTLPWLGSVLWRMGGVEGLRRGLRSAVAPGSAVHELMVEDLVSTGQPRWAGSTKAIDSYLRQQPLAARIDHLDLPVDVVFGLDDRRVDPRSIASYQNTPRVSVQTLRAVGHTPPLEAPRAVAHAIAHARAS